MTTPQAPFCVICNRPIETDSLKYVDEKGRAVHEPCYAAKVTIRKPAGNTFVQSKFDCFA